MGVPGNEYADQLAKASVADREDPGLWDTLVSCYRTRQRELAMEHWRKEWESGPYSRVAFEFIPKPTMDIAIHDRIRRPPSSVLI